MNYKKMSKKHDNTIIGVRQFYFDYCARLDLLKHDDKSRSFISFLEENYSKERIEIIFNECISCNCCETHTKYKPKSLLPYDFNSDPNKSEFILKNYTDYQIEKPCSCFCRSLARDGHRVFNPKI